MKISESKQVNLEFDRETTTALEKAGIKNFQFVGHSDDYDLSIRITTGNLKTAYAEVEIKIP